MLGLLIFIPTLAFVPHYAYLLCVPALIWYYYGPNKDVSLKEELNNERINLWWLVGLVGLSIINNLFHLDNTEGGWVSMIPFFSLTLLVFFVAKQLREIDVKIFILLTLAEVGVCGLELVMGVNSIIPGAAEYQKSTAEGLLYYDKVTGLSLSASAVAMKVFASVLLLRFVNIKLHWRAMALGILTIGAVVTFNRTVILALAVYGAASVIQYLLTMRLSPRFWTRLTLFSLAALALGALVGAWGHETFWYQFTKGKGTVELSGRDGIWAQFGEFIGSNPWFGNGSYKFLIDGAHAHNSFIQGLATHGLFLMGIYLYIVYRNVRIRDIAVLTGVFVYSIMQYGILWGISVMDILLFVLLFSTRLTPVPVLAGKDQDEQAQANA